MSRRLAREKTFQALFQFDLGNIEPRKALEYLLEDSGLNETTSNFARELVKGTFENINMIDTYISKHALGWKLERLAAVERNILRVALYELLFKKEIPFKVSINEAVELARLFGDEGSVSFVNAVLDAVVKNKKHNGVVSGEDRCRN